MNFCSFAVHKEHEMEIGYPTDVKHVAHIGLGTSDTSPSWVRIITLHFFSIDLLVDTSLHHYAIFGFSVIVYVFPSNFVTDWDVHHWL